MFALPNNNPKLRHKDRPVSRGTRYAKELEGYLPTCSVNSPKRKTQTVKFDKTSGKDNDFIYLARSLARPVHPQNEWTAPSKLLMSDTFEIVSPSYRNLISFHQNTSPLISRQATWSILLDLLIKILAKRKLIKDGMPEIEVLSQHSSFGSKRSSCDSNAQ